MNDPEYEEMRRRALEPFRPTRTMDDVLKREAEIREASLAAFKEEASEWERLGAKRRPRVAASYRSWIMKSNSTFKPYSSTN